MSNPSSGPTTCDIVDDGDGPLTLSTDKVFFDVILKKSHVNYPYGLSVPAEKKKHFPGVNLTAVLSRRDRSWNVDYIGTEKYPGFMFLHWKKFVDDNHLKQDDACIFEVEESSNEILRMKVYIIRNTCYLPPELQAIADRGYTEDTAIDVATDDVRGYTEDTAIVLDSDDD